MLYVSDLDNTLLNASAELSGYARDKINELINRDMLFTVATARSWFSANRIIGELNLNLPVILFNGSVIAEFTSGDNLHVQSMDKALLPALFEVVKSHGCVPYISTFNGSENKLYYGEIVNEGMVWFQEDRKQAGDNRMRKMDNPIAIFEETVIGFTIIHQKTVIRALYQELQVQFGDRLEMHHYENAYSRGWQWLSINDKKATKRFAIEFLLKRLDKDPSQLTVFGDSVNDISMFTLADHRIAVANASRDVKRMATEIVDHHTKDPVVKYLLQQSR